VGNSGVERYQKYVSIKYRKNKPLGHDRLKLGLNFDKVCAQYGKVWSCPTFIERYRYIDVPLSIDTFCLKRVNERDERIYAKTQ